MTESSRLWKVVWVVLIAAAALAVVLGVLGGLWGRTPAGNTALVVAFGGGPAVAAGAWVALTQAARYGETGARRMWLGAVLGGVAALFASLAAVYLPMVRSSSPVLLQLVTLGTDVLAAILGVLVMRILGYRLDRSGWIVLAITLAVAIALSTFVPGVGYLLNLVLLPLLVALPVAFGERGTHAPTWSAGQLAVAWLAVLVVVIVGLQIGQPRDREL